MGTPAPASPSTGSTGTWRETLNVSLQVIVLTATLVLGIDSWLASRLDHDREAFAARCRTVVERLAVRSEPAFYTLERMKPFFRPWTRQDLPALRHAVASAATTWGLDLLVFVYDAGGELLGAAPANAPNLWLMKQLQRGLITPSAAEFASLCQKLDKKIPFVFGFGKDLALLRRDRGLAIETFQKTTRGVLLWQSWKSGGVLVHCPVIPPPEETFRRLSATVGEGPAPHFAGLGFRDTDTWKRRGTELDPEARRAWLALQADNRQEGLWAGAWWSFLETTAGRLVYASFPPPPEPLQAVRQMVRLSAAAGLAIVLGALYTFGLGAAFTLRRILLGLFLAAALIPLVGLAIGSLDVVQVYQDVLGTRIQAVQDEAIRNVVQEFDGFVASCAQFIRTATSDPALVGNEEGWRRLADRLRRRQLADVLQVRDASSRLLFSSDPGSNSDREVMVRAMARRAIERYRPERLGEASYTANLFADNMVRRDDMGFSTILNFPGRLQTLQMGNARFLYFFQVPPADVGPVAYIDIIVSLSKAVATYLRQRHGRRLTYDGIWHRFYALAVRDLRWTLPPPPPLRQEIRHLALVSWLTGRPASRRLDQAGHSGFAVAIPCAELADHSLIAYYPDDLVRERIGAVWSKISLGGLFFLGLVGLMAFSISRLFLAPLRHLEEGVAALARRDFEFRLPVAGQDEMARLFSAFNDMMVDSKDLQLARSVQEGLVPQTFPQPPGYSIAGSLETASDLGGDCLDCFALAGDRTVFLIGDITGHGVGSALLMAFSRAITFHWSQGQSLYPDSLTTDIDRMLRRRHGSRLFMGVICGILDPQAHQIDLVVRGHVYPLLLLATGAATWIGTPSYPLGIGTNREEPATLRLPLYPGDRLLCLTDGFIEACDPNGEMVGYERVAEWARQEAGVQSDARSWLDALLARHRKWCQGRHEDDLTTFAIVRHADPSGADGPAAPPATDASGEGHA
ncbi:MAG: Serine phosphatase RsbU, regulator of sigma subunit [Candidatus Ozemobacter sibiricus]|uniref:Serine phosphatase RsbU, regulator of sigma subunit n=1 Tax=Candidatus Ozemobacter sibiricus TaxID=2268124 RepID=A0A367ZKY6_9BACT|nr:MAG: Serine phosphatase RsbU, regulator of sigma subunit [Candidatus Ozemobacter sibiricus]